MPITEHEDRRHIHAITVSRDGKWYFHGAEIIRRDILQLFFDNLDCDDEGYFIEIDSAKEYLNVEDTVFLVVQATLLKGDHEAFLIRLNDGTQEFLNLARFWIARENVPYCMVKDGKFPARLLRLPYYQVAKHAEYDEAADEYYLVLNKERIPIKVIA